MHKGSSGYTSDVSESDDQGTTNTPGEKTTGIHQHFANKLPKALVQSNGLSIPETQSAATSQVKKTTFLIKSPSPESTSPPPTPPEASVKGKARQVDEDSDVGMLDADVGEITTSGAEVCYAWFA